ncbi:hypothetical protein BpHYR1_034391 [Brachionus plicatilis]|uniref:Uncharacterized protein n=1 Tax=Brachionus plicatilis TaxID=10195 RepID=A0A3M7SVT0_BRAPC|nr:hypothetical protein BpHYR1_034391 [Brachionus plicatilis]
MEIFHELLESKDILFLILNLKYFADKVSNNSKLIYGKNMVGIVQRGSNIINLFLNNTNQYQASIDFTFIEGIDVNLFQIDSTDRYFVFENNLCSRGLIEKKRVRINQLIIGKGTKYSEKKNYIRFKSIEKSIELNSVIKTLDFFPHLRFIQIDMFYARSLFQSSLGWLTWLNRDLNVNMSNHSSFNLHKNRTVHVNIAYSSNQQSYDLLTVNEVFPEEDFCIYLNLPFSQMVLLSKT